jgi:pilus assembly protein TadC
MITACLEAGLPLRQAVAAVSRSADPLVRTKLDRPMSCVEVGLSDSDAWMTVKDDPVMGQLAVDIAHASAWGSSLGDVISEHARVLRHVHHSESVIRARAVGVRSVLPLSFCFLPAFVLLGIVPILAGGALGFF